MRHVRVSSEAKRWRPSPAHVAPPPTPLVVELLQAIGRANDLPALERAVTAAIVRSVMTDDLPREARGYFLDLAAARGRALRARAAARGVR